MNSECDKNWMTRFQSFRTVEIGEVTMRFVTRLFCYSCAMSVIAGCEPQANEGAATLSNVSNSVMFNASGAPTIEFILPDMMCEDGCAQAVEDILERQPGAKDVQVDFAGKTATVAIEDGVFDSQQALAALIDKGFENSTLNDGTGGELPAVLPSEK
jgi:copper chaperone CopZ